MLGGKFTLVRTEQARGRAEGAEGEDEADRDKQADRQLRLTAERQHAHTQCRQTPEPQPPSVAEATVVGFGWRHGCSIWRPAADASRSGALPCASAKPGYDA